MWWLSTPSSPTHGIQHISRIRRQPTSVRLILLSAFIQEDDVPEIEALGLVDRALPKGRPNVTAEIVEEIRAAHDRAAADTDWPAYARAHTQSNDRWSSRRSTNSISALQAHPWRRVMACTYLDTSSLVRRAELSGPNPSPRSQHAGTPVEALLDAPADRVATSEVGVLPSSSVPR